jgi:hypothetical protein
MRAQTVKNNVFTTTNNGLRLGKRLQFISQREGAVQEIGETSLLRPLGKQGPRVLASSRSSKSSDLTFD